MCVSGSNGTIREKEREREGGGEGEGGGERERNYLGCIKLLTMSSVI